MTYPGEVTREYVVQRRVSRSPQARALALVLIAVLLATPITLIAANFILIGWMAFAIEVYCWLVSPQVQYVLDLRKTRTVRDREELHPTLFRDRLLFIGSGGKCASLEDGGLFIQD